MRDQLDPDHWCNGGEYGSSHPDALAMEALDAENKQLREKVKLLEEVCDIAQADVKTLDKMNDRLHGELEDLHQALHDARIENSGQAAELERLREELIKHKDGSRQLIERTLNHARKIDQLNRERRWILVDEAHPPANKLVLVYICEWMHPTVSSIDFFGVWRGYQPTHWMPLPAPPKKEVQP